MKFYQLYIILFISSVVCLSTAYAQELPIGSYEKARTICDSLRDAKVYIEHSMRDISPNGNHSEFIFLPKTYTAKEMKELIKSGTEIRCFTRHTTRPSSFNSAVLIEILLVEQWGSLQVAYLRMDVDYVSNRQEKVVIDVRVKTSEVN